MKVGINGMGRIGRLALRAALGGAHRGKDDPYRNNRLDVVHVNEIKGGAAASAHLLTFDTVQGKWDQNISANNNSEIQINEKNKIYRVSHLHQKFLGVNLVLNWYLNVQVNF